MGYLPVLVELLYVTNVAVMPCYSKLAILAERLISCRTKHKSITELLQKVEQHPC